MCWPISPNRDAGHSHRWIDIKISIITLRANFLKLHLDRKILVLYLYWKKEFSLSSDAKGVFSPE